MILSRPVLYTAAVALALAGAALAQNAISAKAGMINVADGDVYLQDAKGGEPRKVEPKVTEFIEIKEGQTLKTGEGRAEVLLVPGSFLRMAEESSFRMISNKLSDARLEMLTGGGLLEVSEGMEDSKVTIVARDVTVSVSKTGLYRIDAEPGRVRVYMGEALVSYGNGQSAVLKGGKELVAGANGWTAGKFDAKETDALYRWAKRRSGYIAMANVSAARQATPQSSGLRSGMWQYNPYFGFATFIPYSSTQRSPFGYYYYTPFTVMEVYFPPNYGYSGGGGGGYGGGSGGFASSMPQRSAGSSGGYSPSAGISSSGASSGSSMGAGSTGSRGGDGGGASSGGASSGGSVGGGGAVSGGGAAAGGGGSRGN
jgi:hypothetical protein